MQLAKSHLKLSVCNTYLRKSVACNLHSARLYTLFPNTSWTFLTREVFFRVMTNESLRTVPFLIRQHRNQPFVKEEQIVYRMITNNFIRLIRSQAVFILPKQ